jgi:hypothetical protein
MVDLGQSFSRIGDISRLIMDCFSFKDLIAHFRGRFKGNYLDLIKGRNMDHHFDFIKDPSMDQIRDRNKDHFTLLASLAKDAISTNYYFHRYCQSAPF